MSDEKKIRRSLNRKPTKDGGVPRKPVAPAFDAGVTTKDSVYRERIMRAVADIREHPVHHGIKMQAHHLISATGMHSSGLGPKIKKFGYDINELQNLVLLPCTLQGACHLGVQPHRGNHTASIDDQRYVDDEHPERYHEMVATRLHDAQLGLSKECPGFLGGAKVVSARLQVKVKLDELSAKILRLIAANPRQAPLTKVALSFPYGNPIGCGGVDSTSRHSGMHKCPVNRDHRRVQGSDQTAEQITYMRETPYVLKAGR
jgi:hypothetical protein